MSHPTGVRGLKFREDTRMSLDFESHPTGVRGLKCVPVAAGDRLVQCRTPLGCVD